jgi:hypothetical protein
MLGGYDVAYDTALHHLADLDGPGVGWGVVHPSPLVRIHR